MTDFPRMAGLSYYIIDTEMYQISHKQIFFKVFYNISCMNFFLLFFVSSIIYLILINKANLTGKQGIIIGYALHVNHG